MRDRGRWMWLPSDKGQSEEEPRFVFFRGKMEVLHLPPKVHMQITADSRYKLYVNGQFVEMGPSRGNDKVWYVDEIDITPYLKKGENIIAVIVLRYPFAHWSGNCGIFRTKTPGLYVKSTEHIDWRCRLAEHIHIAKEDPYFAPLMIYEKTIGNPEFSGWKTLDYIDEEWEVPVYYAEKELPDVLQIHKLKRRTIPFLYRKEKQFVGICGQASKTLWEPVLCGSGKVRIEAHKKVSVDIDAGELMTGYLKLQIGNGADAKISILQSECYAGEIVENADPYKSRPLKSNRMDDTLYLYGYTDTYIVAGNGNEATLEVYEPFWFRTFRYIRLSIETQDTPLDIYGIDYEETGYPLQVSTKVQTSDTSLADIWDISERSLRRCMHESYEDCPFYEQLQYALDTRSQILYTYAISADDRLARKAIEDFAQSIREDGMINCSYPNFETNVIPGFAIFYIGMLYDHMMYFGDKEFLNRYVDIIKRILDFFEHNLDERGLVAKVGGLNRPENYWSFIDWTPGWDDTDGVPPCTLVGPITMESLYYVLGLQYAEEIANYLGVEQDAIVYQKRAEKVQYALQRHCVGKNGMYQDGPGIESYSQHSQVFAVLTDSVSKEEGRKLLQETLEHKEEFEQCSVAMMYYLFRALEKCDLYEYTSDLWDIWRDMLKNNMTTCGEEPVMCRSDCHAWGALALYELPSVVLGVRPGKPGFEEVLIKPHRGKFEWAKGEVITPKGKVYVAWRLKEDGTMHIEANTSKEMNLVIEK